MSTDFEQGREGYGMGNSPRHDQGRWDGQERRAPEPEPWWKRILIAGAVSLFVGALSVYATFTLTNYRVDQIEAHIGATDTRVQGIVDSRDARRVEYDRRLNSIENKNERQDDFQQALVKSVDTLTNTMVQLQRDSTAALTALGGNLVDLKLSNASLSQKVDSMRETLADIISASRKQSGQPTGPPGKDSGS